MTIPYTGTKSILLPRNLYRLMHAMWFITVFMANLHIYSFEKWLLMQSLLPCYNQLKNVKTKKLEAAKKYFSVCKIQFQLDAFCLFSILLFLEESLCHKYIYEGFLLALNTCLEYSFMYTYKTFFINNNR